MNVQTWRDKVIEAVAGHRDGARRNLPFCVAIYPLLLAAGPLTVAKVREIVGHRAAAQNYCHECRQDKPVVVQLGEEPDYESATASICIDCLRAALALAEAALPAAVEPFVPPLDV